MTREEAKEVIKAYYDKLTNSASNQLDGDIKAFEMAIEALNFDIDQYCKEHFCVMVDKDLWEKAEKALKQEPKTGYWIDHQDGRWIYAKCSECGTVHDTQTNFCPNCGAEMKEGDA